MELAKDMFTFADWAYPQRGVYMYVDCKLQVDLLGPDGSCVVVPKGTDCAVIEVRCEEAKANVFVSEADYPDGEHHTIGLRLVPNVVSSSQ
jgi:hypothetical protein